MTDIIDLEETDDEFAASDNETFLLAEANAVNHTNIKKRPSPFPTASAAATKKLKFADEVACTSLARRILQQTWGFPRFRLKQEEAIARLISGGSAVVIFPTGGGKSLVYQVPALAFDDIDQQRGLPPGRGLTLVVSPLIALMKVDQRIPILTHSSTTSMQRA